ncbi:Putative transcriptional regulator YwtF [Mycolicibacterium phlei]|uniref:LCP family protein n=1 Tax=Mycolicibacterium phlei TaxID=1771 RepID=UPI00078EBB0D|nr:Putative transcriptional regulator YwtF [Mycolicibacterium phlei]
MAAQSAHAAAAGPAATATASPASGASAGTTATAITTVEAPTPTGGPAARATPAAPGAAHPPKPPKPPKPPRRKRHWGRILAALVLLLVVAVVAGGLWIDSSLQRTPALADYPGRPAAGAGTTWLLVGSDSRRDLTPEQQAQLATGGDLGDGRTDTILLVHLPGLLSDTPATLVSIPRDSYVEIPGHGSDKINAASVYGGAPLLVQTVEQVTGLRIDHYAEIGFGGFAALVDAVGGVQMCPAEPIVDPLAGIDLPAGCQELDGRSALGFVRTRATPRADLDRMVHQREFMSALLHRASSPTVLLNPLRLYPMARAATRTLTVNTGDHIWDLARLGWAMRGDIVTVTVPIGEYATTGAGSVVIWADGLANQLFEALRTDAPLPGDVLDAQP